MPGAEGGRDRRHRHPAGRPQPNRPHSPRPEPQPPAFAPPPGTRLLSLQTLEVTIEKLIAGGEGLARHDGVPIFVPRSAPGDVLRVRLVEHRPDYARAEIEAILHPGPGRRPDPVPELATWGGCDLQHIDDALQPRLKAAAVRETLERLGRVDLPADIPVVTGDPWHYRLRTQLQVEARGGDVRIGYHARGTNDLLPITRCPLLVPQLEALLPGLPGRLAAAYVDGETLPHRLDLAAGDGGAVAGAPVVAGLPHGELTLAVGDFTYAFDARCFFQAHHGLLPRLVETAVGPWDGGQAGEAYDLYAGVGLFTLPLARRYGRVVAVEGERVAARYARTNARRNRLPGVDVVAQSLESWVAHLPARPARVIVDPPRAGLSTAVRKALLESHPERLTYVSCHAATLARDLRRLATAYDLEKVYLVDLFPQTGHMETVVQMVLR